MLNKFCPTDFIRRILFCTECLLYWWQPRAWIYIVSLYLCVWNIVSLWELFIWNRRIYIYNHGRQMLYWMLKILQAYLLYNIMLGVKNLNDKNDYGQQKCRTNVVFIFFALFLKKNNYLGISRRYFIRNLKEFWAIANFLKMVGDKKKILF